MEESINSDITMCATNTFNNILHEIQKSCLNYHLQMSPYSAIFSIKKSFQKDRSGQLILPVLDNKHCADNTCVDTKYRELQQEVEKLVKKHEELFSELSAAYDTIDVLKKINTNQNETLSNLENENMCTKEALIVLKKNIMKIE